jgi:endonuclease YncB( thermonuclease family)
MYKVIKGTFHVAGYSPDGDSIRFQADNGAHWDFFDWQQASEKKAKKKQLRFEAIDALETHYEEAHQPRSFGVAALEVMLDMMGIKNPVYNIAITKIVSAADGSPGFIASASLDMYDRPISLVFDAGAGLTDGQELAAADLPLTSSVNLRLLKLGLVYPTFYSSMEQELLDAFTLVARKARKGKIGLWALDKTPEFMLWNKDTIQDDVVILPKLFRRLTSFFIAKTSYDELQAYLVKSGDKIKLRASGQIKSMHEIMHIDGRKIRFLEKPEDLIFEPKG